MPNPFIVSLNTDIHDRVLELVDDESPGRVLDVGAGDGALAQRLQDAGHEVQAVDLITRDFRPRGIPISEADLNQGIQFSDGEFSIVVATEVIEHLENPWQFLRELYRVTEPGGLVVISTPNLANVYVRVLFALTGRLYNFMEASYRDIGHITPVYTWNLERMAEDKFDIERVTVNASPVPRTRLKLPTRSRLLGQCIVVLLRRRVAPAVAKPRVWQDSRIVRQR